MAQGEPKQYENMSKGADFMNTIMTKVRGTDRGKWPSIAVKYCADTKQCDCQLRNVANILAVQVLCLPTSS